MPSATTSQAGKDPRYVRRPDTIVDQYSFYDFKKAFSGLGGTTTALMNMPSWVPQEETRRLRSYQLLERYYTTSSRIFLNTDDEGIRDKRREYGDAYVIVEAVLASLTGNDQTIQVEGAVSDENKQGSGEVQLQELLEDWAKKEKLKLRTKEVERNAIKLGDGVYVLGWDEKKKRPRLRVYDPDSYFPVLDPESDEDFPRKIHIAYEFERFDPSEGKKVLFVRRITWELREVDGYRVPWEEEEVTESCFLSDMTWKIGDAKGAVDEFNPSTASTSRFVNEDLEIDFLPVIHIPNPPTSVIGHYGTSTIANVVQLIDDVIGVDTDLQTASGLTGMPVLGVSGTLEREEGEGSRVTYAPGTAFQLGEGGKLDMLDTSRSLDALLKLAEELLDRLSVNARTPGTLLGRVDPAQVQAGVILTLSFAPHTTMIREMRDVRDEKNSLMLKMVTRFFWLDDQISKEFPVKLKLGSYLPADRQEVIGMITNGLNSHSMSLETAITLMIEAGFPVEDIAIEIDRIQRRNYDAAVKVHDATENPQFAADLLELGEVPEEMLSLPGAERELQEQALEQQASNAEADRDLTREQSQQQQQQQQQQGGNE